MDKEKNEKKNEVLIKKLEGEVLAFQKQWIAQWETFLTNDFVHLLEKVDALTANVGGVIQQNKVMQRKMGILEKNILIILKNTTIDLGK